MKVSQNLAVECYSHLAIEDQQTLDKDTNFCGYLDQAVQVSNQYRDNED